MPNTPDIRQVRTEAKRLADRIARDVERMRRRLGLTQADVARICKLDQSQVSHVLSGSRLLPETRLRYALKMHARMILLVPHKRVTWASGVRMLASARMAA